MICPLATRNYGRQTFTIGEPVLLCPGFLSGHSREETRYYRSLTHLVEPLDPEGKWAELVSVGMAEYMRVEKSGKVSLERRYYISSLS